MRAGRRRGLAVAMVATAVATLAGCSASRSASSPTIPGVTAPTTAPTTAPASAPASAPPPTPAPDTADTAAATSAAGSTAPVTPDTVATGTTVAGAVAPTPNITGTTLAPITPEQWSAVDAALGDRLLGSGDFAFSLAVSVDGVPVHAAAFGQRNHPDIELPPPETSVPVTVPGEVTTTAATTTTAAPPPAEPVDVDDRFRIASISKVLTGTVVLQLVADGTLQLDEPVGAALGTHLGVDVTGRPAAGVTVRQLLSHTSGFGVYERTFFNRGVETCHDAAVRGFDQGLQDGPGTTYRYSNMNYCVLEQLIEAATGEPYEQVVNERLLTPLGLTGMRMAGTFDPRPDEVMHPSFPGRNYMETLGAAGAWMATPRDIVTVVDSLDNTKPGWHPLPDDLAELMRQPIPGIAYNKPAERWYGLATIAWANLSWGHTGTIENTHAMVVHRPDGMTWALFVSGNVPAETDDLAGILQAAIDEAGIIAPAPTTTTTTTTTTTLAPTTVAGATAAPAGEATTTAPS